MRAPEHDDQPREMEAAPATETRTAPDDAADDAPDDEKDAAKGRPPTSRTDETEPALHKQVERYRPWYLREQRAVAWLVAISLGTIGASAGLMAWTASAPRQMMPRDVAPATLEPDPGASAPVVADEVEATTALLAADDAIGEAVDRVPVADGAPAVRGVAAAADDFGVIALWTDRVVWVSRDDGRSFRQELAAPEPLTAVAVGPDGRVYAARHGGRLGVLSPAGHTRWLDVDCDQILAIATAPPAPRETAAPWLAVLGLHADRDAGAASILWLSDDHGRTWRHLIAPHHGDASNRLRVSPDGVIDLLTEDSDESDSGENGERGYTGYTGGANATDGPGATDGPDGTGDTVATFTAGARLRHYRGHVDGRPFALAFAGDAPAPLAMGHDGLSWHLESKAGRMQLAAAGRTDGHGSGHTDSHGAGHTDGHGTGHTDGHGTGHTDSHGAGHTDSHGAGHTDSHGAGHTDGHDAGRSDGHGAGHTDGHDAGRSDGRVSAPVRNWDVRVAAGGERTFAVADGHLIELGRGRPRVVTRRVPGRVDALAVDGIGRAVATVGGSALRYSPRHGWRRLFEIPPR